MPNFLELRAMVAENLAQPISDGGRLTTARVGRAVNDGYVRFALDTRCFRRTAMLTALPGQEGYLLPGDVLEALQVWYGDRRLSACTVELLDARRQDWRTQAAGTPEVWLRSGATTLQLVPAPLASGTLLLEAEVTPSPVDGGIPLLTVDEDTPQLPYLFQNAPALWATVQLAAFLFPDDPVSTASAQAALEQYRELAQICVASLVARGAYDE